ncbi:MAG: hypothetical protein ACT4N2_02595 [Hyphomicrobium sp.]
MTAVFRTLDTHALVESLAAAAAVRAHAQGRLTWHTTSPQVAEVLGKSGEPVIWADAVVSDECSREIGLAAVDAVRLLERRIDGIATAIGFPSLTPVVCTSLSMLLGLLCFKRAVLERFCKNEGTRLVAGSAVVSPVRGGDPQIGRYDTLYSVLAVDLNTTRLDVVPGDQKALYQQIDESVWSDRILSAIDFSAPNVVSRLLRFVSGANGLNRRGTGPIVLIGQENEAVREMLPHLLKAGATLNVMPKMMGAPPGQPVRGLPEASEVAAALDEALANRSLTLGTRLIAGIASQRLMDASRCWCSAIETANAFVAKVMTDRSRMTFFLTNTIGSVDKAALAERLRHEGVSIVVAEHGVSAGLSRFHEPLRSWSEPRLADLYLACSQGAVEFYREASELNETAFSAIGLAEQTRRVSLAPLQRAVTRRRFKVGKGNRLVIYLARAVQNNMRKISHSLEDHREHAIESTMLTKVLPKVRGTAAIKLYPTTRYLDPYDGDISESADNVRVVKAGDFRYLRAAADIIILSSPLSTLGWAFGANRPIFYLEDLRAPLRADVRVKMRNSVFYLDISNDDWPDRLILELNRSDEEIAFHWRDKAAARREFLAHYIFGPEGCGVRGVEAMLSFQPSRPSNVDGRLEQDFTSSAENVLD